MFYANCYKYELFILSFSLLLICECSEVPRPRGVSISKTSLYSPDKDFTCFDGSQTIRFSEVNDDYCDCFDGSDEPGTSACINGVFHCTNAGHRPENIPSSRVNDGICDCCDGSDEYAHPTAGCIDTCLQLGREARIEAQKRAELLKAGSQLRADAILKGGILRREMADKVEQLQRDREEAEALRQEKLKSKESAEDLEKTVLKQFRLEEEKLKEISSRNEAREFFSKHDTNTDGILSMFEIQASLSFDKDRDGVVTEEEAVYFLGDTSEVSKEEFFDKTWSLIKPLLMAESGIFKPPIDKIEAETEEDDNHEEDGEHGDEHEKEDLDSEGDGEGDDDIETGHDGHKEDEEVQDAEPQYDPDTQRVVSIASDARSQYMQAERSVRDIDHEISALKESLDKDFGSQNEFATLSGQCFEYTDREYVYKLCPFDKAIQQPKRGGGETRLGTWGEWAGDESNKYSIMLYKDGTGCWNGPNRSAKVHIHCGLETIISSVSEPNRCEYIFEMSTPAACLDSDNQQQSLHDEL